MSAVDTAAKRGELPPSASFPLRSWGWLPGPCREYPFSLGALTITQRRSPRDGAKVEADVYSVSAAPSNGGYELQNYATRDLYSCVPSARWCTCRAGQSGQRCKHLDALDALLAEGAL